VQELKSWVPLQSHAVDLDHGTLPDMTAKALHRLADRISRLEQKLELAPDGRDETEEESWFYQI
jgi:hypothetical protein